MTFDERYEEIARRLCSLQAAGDRVCGPPVREQDFTAAEQLLGLQLPEAYRRLLCEFGPLVSTHEWEMDDDSRLGCLLKRKVRCHSRSYMLAPGTSGEDDLVRLTSELRRGNPALPSSLLPYRVVAIRAGRHVTHNYDCLDFERLKDDEPTYCKWMSWADSKVFHPKEDSTFLERLESEVSGPCGIDGRHAPYEALAARLRSEDCTDQFTYADPPGPADIARTEEALGVALPQSYKRFLADFGPADLANTLLDPRPDAKQSILRVTGEQRRSSPALPDGLIPFALGVAWAGPMRFETSYLCFDYRRLLYGEPAVTTWAPKSPREDRRNEADQVFLDWLEARIRWAEEHPSPPDDWRNNAGWDRYWRRVLRDDYWRKTEARHPAFGLWRELSTLRERGYRRILFAGNGFSLEPHAFAHLGFDVTALDVSPTVGDFVETTPVTLEHLRPYLNFGFRIADVRGRKPDASELQQVPGGSLMVVTADMFDYVPAEPFDVVYSCRSYQAFSDEDRRTLARQFHAWLRPGGLCIVETINLCMGGHDREIETSFEGTGFLVHGRETTAWFEEATRPGLTFPMRERRARAELERHRAEEREREAQHLASGGKVVVFSHGSG